MTASLHTNGTNRLLPSGVWSNNLSRPWRQTSLMIGSGSPRRGCSRVIVAASVRSSRQVV